MHAAPAPKLQLAFAQGTCEAAGTPRPDQKTLRRRSSTRLPNVHLNLSFRPLRISSSPVAEAPMAMRPVALVLSNAIDPWAAQRPTENLLSHLLSQSV
jgi:hypothetical protein